MEEETSRQVSPGKPAGTEQHFIPAANPARAPRACRHRAGHGFGQGLAQGNGRSWGQGRALTLRAARGLCATHALTIAWHQHPAEPWANAPACSRRSGTCCPATLQPACRRAAGCREDLLRLPGGSAPAASPVAEDALLPVQSETPRWFGNVNDGCNGLRGSSRAAELGARAALRRARGAGGWNLPRQLPQGWAG